MHNCVFASLGNFERGEKKKTFTRGEREKKP